VRSRFAILLHGGPGFDHSSFKPLFSRLADIAQVLYVDHRGHGRSDRCSPAYWNLDTFADDVVRLCAALGIARPIVLGQSYGGFVAQRYLARHPDHPAKVILSSTSHHMGLARKLAMFERLGGTDARRAAETFWTDPTAATWADYERVCRPHYNTTQPGNDDAKRRTIAVDEILFTPPATMPTMQLLRIEGRVLPGAGDGRRRRPGDTDRGRTRHRSGTAAAIAAVRALRQRRPWHPGATCDAAFAVLRRFILA
jgi:proline iminopeptidase